MCIAQSRASEQHTVRMKRRGGNRCRSVALKKACVRFERRQEVAVHVVHLDAVSVASRGEDRRVLVYAEGSEGISSCADRVDRLIHADIPELDFAVA